MNKFIDTKFTEIDSSTEEEYLTIDEIAKILEVEEFQIIYWCNKFNDILKIQSIGMYSIFNEVDINNLKIIKHLEIDKKMNTRQIREYISKQQHEGLIVKKQKQELSNESIIQVLAKVINLQNQQILEVKKSNEQILETNNQLLNMQKEFKDNFLEFCDQMVNNKKQTLDEQDKLIKTMGADLQKYIATTVTETIDKQLDNNKEEIQSTIQQSQEALSRNLSTAYKRRDVELVDDLKHILEERKEKLAQEEDNKGFFKKLFNRK